MSTSNGYVFAYLRRRAAFVRTHQGMESYVIWGAAADCVARINYRRRGETFKGKPYFATSLIELTAGDTLNLATISIPFVVADLKRHEAAGKTEAAALLRSRDIPAEVGSHGRIWSANEDVALNGAVSRMLSLSKEHSQLANTFRYADILYRDVRCPAVHALDFGHRSWEGDEGRHGHDTGPEYQNCLISNSDPRSAHNQHSVRIAFSRKLLATLLDRTIDRVEAACIADSFEVPPYATHDDI